MPVRLGQLEIHAELNEIGGPAGRRRLEPQAIAVLALFVADPGRVWSRDELLDQAWPGRVVSDGTLTGVISRLRIALKAAGVNDVRIETRSKRGYVLVDAKPEPGNGRRLRPAYRSVAAALGAVIALIAAWQSGILPTAMDSVEDDFVLVTFNIETPWGETVEPVIVTEQGRSGEIHLFEDNPLRIRFWPQARGDSAVHLRFELNGITHWGGFEQVVPYGEETLLRLPVDGGNAGYELRFIAERLTTLPDFVSAQKK